MALALGIIAGIGWATAIVAYRVVIEKTQIPVATGALYSITVAGLTALVIAIIFQGGLDFSWSNADELFYIGLAAPGLSQLTYFISLANIGPSRAGIFIGVAPVFSVLGAYLFSDGELNVAVGLGTLLVVGGGGLLSAERTEGTPKDNRIKILGISAGLTTAFLFGVRDVLSDKILTEENLNSAFSAGVLWLAGIPLFLAYIFIQRAFSRHGSRSGRSHSTEPQPTKSNSSNEIRALFLNKSYSYIAIPGIIQGIALSTMLEAFKRGRVEIITPFSSSIATVGAVFIALAVLGQRELNFRIGISMVLVAIGAVLVSSLG